MLANDMLKFMLRPYALKQEDVARLQKLVEDFPYFQPAHLLLSMASRMWDPSVYQQSLKKTALLSSSRSHLFNLIRQTDKILERQPVPEEQKEEKKIPDKITDTILEELEVINSVSANSPEPSRVETELKTGQTLPEEILAKDESYLEEGIKQQVTLALVDKEIIGKSTEVSLPPVEEPEPETKQVLKETAANFTDWLNLLKQPQPKLREHKKAELKESPLQAGQMTEELKLSGSKSQEDAIIAKKLKQKALIDKIIESSPGAIRPKEDQKFFTPEKKAKESLLENEHLVTETLARIYALQGNVAKAIRSYEILSLKYPQKSTYFASLIQKLKNNQ